MEHADAELKRPTADAFLSELRQKDPELYDQVQRLLLAREDTGSIPGGGNATSQISRTPGVNDLIGPYRLLSVLGEGGMGIVYLAEQERPIKRRLALKLIKPGIASSSAVARFESERQTLAMMEHPNIAHVYDAGTTEAGQPYFVMEYVPGPSITAYCDQHKLRNRERLRLFRSVCLAIHHAHQKGVIHQDIKPSNVLVTEQGGAPVPKVIDFGVAKAIEQHQAGQTLFTLHGVLAGTPEYMSPEQANLETRDVDASSDVYSLGVLLYELLVGALPFDPKELRKKGLAEILRIIREDSPTPLSSRLGTLSTAQEVAQLRDTDQGSLRRQLTGELDWITIRALEKDRRRRYNSAAEFAGDIGHYLNNEPVIAGPLSRFYRMRKFVSKHRWPVAAAAAVVAALCAGLVTSTLLYFRAERARQETGRQREAAQMRGNEAVAERIEAQKQRDRAELEADRATSAAATALSREKDAQWQSYIANIRAAGTYIRDGELTAAQQTLLACEPSLRGWEWRYLWSRSDTGIATLSPSLPVSSFGFSRDGRQILVATEGHVEHWNSSDFAAITSYSLGPEISKLYKISPDGSRLVALSVRSSLELVEAGSRNLVRTLREAGPNSGGDVRPSAWSISPAVAFSPDSTLVAAAFPDGSIWVWSAETGERITSTSRAGLRFSALALSPDGTKIAAGLQGGGIWIWELHSDRVQEFILGPGGHNTSVSSISFNTDGRLVAWAESTYLRVLEVDPGRLRVNVLVTPNIIASGITTVAFSPDNKRLLVSRLDGATELRDAASGQRLETLADGGRGNMNGRAAFSPDGKFIFAETNRGVVRVFSADVRDVRVSLRLGGTLDVSMQRFAEALTGDSVIRAWQVESGMSLPPSNTELGSVPLRFSRDGTRLATGSPGNTFTVWNAITFKPVATFSGHTAGIDELEFSEDGGRIASAGQDNKVRVWNIRSGRLLSTIPRPAARIALNLDGSRVAISPRTGLPFLLEVFDVSSGSTVLVLDGPAVRFSFSPYGRQIAVADRTGISLRNSETGSLISRLVASSSSPVSGLKFTPDGSRLAVARSDGSITLWDPNRGGPVLVVTGCETQTPFEAYFEISPERLVCINSDGMVRTWDARLADYPGARRLAESLLEERFVVAEVVRELERNTTIAALLRKAAIAEARLHHDDLFGLYGWVAILVSDPAPSQTDLQLAEDRMRAVVSNLPYPDNMFFPSVMGGVLYRLGRYKEALLSLNKNFTDNMFGAGPRAINRSAFLAMTYYRLGKQLEAREQLLKMRQAAVIAGPPTPAVSELLMREADALIEGVPRR